MAMKSKKVWFQISWMWKLFPFCLLMIIYCIVTCEEDYLDYALHNDDYRIVEGEIIEVYEKVYSHYRQKNYMYFSKVVIQGQGNDVIELTADMEDYVGKKISVAVNIDNPDKIQRTEWIVFRSNKQIMLWFFFLCGVFLIVGKIISYFMIRRLSIEGETMDKNAIWINESRSKDGRSGRILDVMSDGIKVVAYGIITIISIHSEEYIVACVFGGFTILCLWMLCYGKR